MRALYFIVTSQTCFLPQSSMRGILSTKLMTVVQYGLFFLWSTDFRKALFLFSHSVMSDSLRPHGLQHARLPGPLPSSRVCSNSYPLSQWCHPVISSSIIPFSSCPQSFSASGPFLVSQLFASGGQSIGASASASVLSMNIQGWFPLGSTDFISLLPKGLWRVFQYHSWKASIPWHKAFFVIQPSHPYMTTGKTIASTTWTFIGKVMSLLFNTLSRFVVAFLPRSKCLLISRPLAITKMLLSLPLGAHGQYQVFHVIQSHFLLL